MSGQVSTQARREAQLLDCKMGSIQVHLQPRDLLDFIIKTIRIPLSFLFSKTLVLKKESAQTKTFKPTIIVKVFILKIQSY
jgi:hypothetical protein